MRVPVVFVTDYGRDDAYAAALIGAAWRVDPEALCVEGTHGVPAGDVLAGAYHLKSLALAYQRNVVFCAVVDPGVGSERRAIAIATGEVICVAPDNGLVSYLWQEAAENLRGAVQLEVPVDSSATFHGRDVFAPIAAELASGMHLDDAGPAIGDPLILADAFAQQLGNGLQGTVCVVDHFGNAITTVRDIDVAGRRIARVSWGDAGTGRIVSTYAEIDEGLAALIGSAGHVEIAANGERAVDRGGPALHHAITVEFA